jgi:hypothetical protein
MPFTPGLLSMTMVWPSVADIFSAKARPIWSVALPAAKGTTARIGLFGYGLGQCAELKAGRPDHGQAAGSKTHGVVSFFGFGGRVVGAVQTVIRVEREVQDGALKVLPCASSASERVTPPPSASFITKCTAPRCGSG